MTINFYWQGYENEECTNHKFLDVILIGASGMNLGNIDIWYLYLFPFTVAISWNKADIKERIQLWKLSKIVDAVQNVVTRLKNRLLP